MSGNSFGSIFRMTTYGESHGPGVGVIIDGCPSGVTINEADIRKELDRRKPGQSKITTSRKESELFRILSGVFEGKSTGAPISVHIPNENQISKDYSHLKDTYRPSHADYTFTKKYGFRDYRGGGRSSARETAARVIAGAIAKMILSKYNITVHAYVSAVGNISISKQELKMDEIEQNIVRCPNNKVAARMEALIKEIKKKGDTIGGIVECVINNVPIGLGQPVFDKLHADLAKGMVSINAVKGFEIGSGFASSQMLGSEHNDEFYVQNKILKTKTNHSGGIQGGISNGMPIVFRTAFKPVSTIMKDQKSINQEGNEIDLKGKGRHDPCVVPRAVPIIEAMAAVIIVDHLLRTRSDQL